MNVPHWNIECYGTVSRRNVAWTALVSLLVRREGKMVDVRPEDMLIGEIGTATFGLGFTAGMSKKQKRQHEETRVERVEDQPDRAI